MKTRKQMAQAILVPKILKARKRQQERQQTQQRQQEQTRKANGTQWGIPMGPDWTPPSWS
jgi:hypothetical protein